MNPPRLLIAGVGNIFLGDDAFGVEVVRRLAGRPMPDGVRVIDFGIRGLDLTYALLDGYDSVILVDALPRGGKPGDLYLIEPDLDAPEVAEPASSLIDTHNMDPVKVLRLVAAMGGRLENLRIVGCEPTPATLDDMQMELSESVAAAVDEAVSMIESLATEFARSNRMPLPSERDA